ncbi:MAG: hypothetical protein IKP28_05975 [Clostridia bacterium]|nr:hypothetical protein [Clostridia bacterium]
MLYIEIVKFLLFSGLIVLISKYILVRALRNLAECLNLNAKAVGDIAGFATSVPELLTITTASIRGLSGASIYNILSSNIINLIQYLAAIAMNNNGTKLKNKAIKTNLVLVAITILIPIALLQLNIELSIVMVPIFITLYIFFRFINNNAHKLYLKKEDKEIEEEIEAEKRKQKRNDREAVKQVFILILATVALYIIGDKLGDTLETLCVLFNVPQFIIGILLGVMTSIPELITFFESQKHGKRSNDEVIGVIEATNNLLTSNMFNLFIIQAIGILLINIFR